MPLITIRKTADFDTTPNAALSFDRQGEFPITVTNPFSEQEETLLEWYFEDRLCFPFTKQVYAEKAAQSITAYGERLFEQVFRKDVDIFSQYTRARSQGVNQLRFEIIGSPDFHRLHWEALKDPDLPRPFVTDAPMIRGNSQARTFQADVQPSRPSTCWW